ncbi:MAG: YgiQ family radical SAM protein [Prevotellaceae bacterium]|nr:YgiQ family radical SAM protein [Prevotellaceae bacterium]
MKNFSVDKVDAFLPTSKKEVEARSWDELDVILFTGDAYIDHPSFGAAMIGRVLEAEGLRVAIIPQPNWRDDLRDFKKLGVPRLFFGVTSGCMDSMVNHYTANKRLRSNDAYTPEGKAGYRPDYAVTVYTKILKQLYSDTPVVLGGIEASLRRTTHYDYWNDSLKPSVLVDSGADILVYGMGEQPVREIIHRLERKESLIGIPQTAIIATTADAAKLSDYRLLPFYEECKADKRKFAEHFRVIEEEANVSSPRPLVEPLPNYELRITNQKQISKLTNNQFSILNSQFSIIVFPPYSTMSTSEIDASYDLPYTRLPHPRYKDKHIPAYEMIKFSVNIHRGCFGGCSFCTIAVHQGKEIVERSEQSILSEIAKIAQMPGFKGYLSDLGGPSANMYSMHGKSRKLCNKCCRFSCIHPTICKNLDTSHRRLLALYKQVEALPKIKKAFVGSGIRYDLFLNEKGFFDDTSKAYFTNLLEKHISGRLKVAPEHTEEHVLKIMRKPSFALFEQLKKVFDEYNRNSGKCLQLIPYFISSHPGCTEKDMRQLAKKMRYLSLRPEQVQDFTPTPMTHASTIFYTGIDSANMKKMYVAHSKDEKLSQKDYFFKL